MHLFKRADGFMWVYDCISAMRDVIRASQELRRSESKRRSTIELSNNISERRCELKANESVNEGSE